MFKKKLKNNVKNELIKTKIEIENLKIFYNRIHTIKRYVIQSNYKKTI